MFKEIITLTSSYKYKFFRECFITNCNTFKESSLDKRATTTINALTKLLVCNHWLTVKEHLKSLEQIDCWVWNVSVYTAAYTIRQYGGELKTTAPTQNKKKETLKWIKNIETSIENTRKFIGKLTTVTVCKKTNTFFKNQKCLKDMFEKEFVNTKLQTLEYKLEVYKQKLKASCAKLKYQKMLQQRKVINRQFSNNPRQFFHQMTPCFKSWGITIKEWRCTVFQWHLG